MLTLDEAIAHCEEVAEKYCEKIEEGLTADDFCDSCASEHRQLADWLRELKAYKEIINDAPKIVTEKYGADIVEGYADIYQMLKEVQK